MLVCKIAPSSNASAGRSRKVSTSSSENRDCWPCSIGLLGSSVVVVTIATTSFGMVTNCLLASVVPSLLCVVLLVLVWRRFATGSSSRDACFVRSCCRSVSTNCGTSRTDFGCSACLAGFEGSVGRGEGIARAILSRPRIVMLSPSSVFCSSWVVERAWVSSSCHSSCDNYNVRCRLALGGGAGSANVCRGGCAYNEMAMGNCEQPEGDDDDDDDGDHDKDEGGDVII